MRGIYLFYYPELPSTYPCLKEGVICKAEILQASNTKQKVACKRDDVDTERCFRYWGGLFIGSMDSGDLLGSYIHKDDHQISWFFDPMLRAMKLAEWKEKNKRKKHARESKVI